MKYSASTRGFYAQEIHGQNIPSDAVEITSERHIELLEGQSTGKQIVPDENGFPILITPEPVVVIPTEITMWHAHKWLYRNGHYGTIEAAIAAVGGEAMIDWRTAQWVKRGNLLCQAMQSVLGFTDAQMDHAFVEASQITE